VRRLHPVPLSPRLLPHTNVGFIAVLPFLAEHLGTTIAMAGRLFALSSLLVITFQTPVTRWAADRLGLHRSMTTGLLLISAGFAAVALARPGAGTGTSGLLPATAFVLLLTFGQMLVLLAARARVPDLRLPAAATWLILSAVPALAATLLPRTPPHRGHR
jgi:MFS family permease